jgi:two-component system, response regulator
MENTMEPQTVLLVEDDVNDVFFFRRALEKHRLPFELQVARDGQEAQDYLRGQGKFADRETFRFPKFIITDNHLPPHEGPSFLRWLKGHPKFRVVPTIMLSGTDAPADVLNAYDALGVHSYILKPSGSEELAEAVALIFKYWAMCIVPPSIQDNEEEHRRSIEPAAMA